MLSHFPPFVKARSSQLLVNRNSYSLTCQWKIMKKIQLVLGIPEPPVIQKLTRIMKLMTVLLLAACMHVSAGGFSQKKISIRFESVDVRKALSQIEKKSELRFLYNQALLDGFNKVTLEAKDELVTTVLNRIFNETAVNYQLLDNGLVVLKTRGAAMQDVQVRGKIMDEKGEPIAGASVRVKGTNLGTAADAEGAFSLNVPDDATLVVSFVGYTEQEVQVNGRTEINVVLVQSTQSLDQVVVIGYGSAARRDLTGSIQTIKGSEVADKPATNPMAALQGKVPGLTIVNSGRPGQEPDIRIRGTNTINGVKPIYVVDGIINDNINFINPADIESMEILKDPSSLAIFGVRGANGVIIVTTKKAKSGQLTVNFNSTVGIKKVVDRIKLTNGPEFKMLYDEQLANQGNPAFDYTNWQANTDWQDLIFQDAVLNYNNISITGATDKNRFYLGVGYVTEEGLIKHEQFQKATLNFNDELQVSKALRFGINFNGYRAKLPVNKDVGTALTAAPIAPVYNEAYGLYHTMPGFQRAQVFNPLNSIEVQANNARNYEYRGVGSIFGEVNFLNDFTFRASFFADYGFNTGRSYAPQTVFYNPEISPVPVDSVQPETSVNEYKNTYIKAQSDYLLTYKKRFGEHSLTAMGGFTTYFDSYAQTTASVRQGSGRPIPNDPRFWYANASIGDASTLRGNSDGWERANLSYLFRALYNYKGRYLLNASFRRDGSSGFFRRDGQGQIWQNFGAVGAAWEISEENFMSDVEAIDYLKLKASWGVLGNQNSGDRRYPSFAPLTGANAGVFGDNVVQALQPEYFVDPNLHWETVHSWETGIELNTFRNRMHVEANYYNKKTKDILVIIPPLGTSGGVGELSNVGEVSNNGFEFLATWNDKISKDWNYSISGNITTINNKVNFLVRDGFEIVSDPSRTRAGLPIGYFFGFISEGIYQTQEEIIKSPANLLNEVKPGDIKFRDVNGDGQIDNDDRTMIGNPTPDFTYGVAFNISYKGFDLNLEGQGVYGNEIFRNWNKGTFTQFNFGAYQLGRWNGVGTSNWEPILHTGRANNVLNSTYYIEDGSYFRFRNIQLGYSFSTAALEKLHMKSLRVFLNAQNLKTFKNNTGYTPEFGGSSTQFGVDNGSYPLPAIYSFGVNLNF